MILEYNNIIPEYNFTLPLPLVKNRVKLIRALSINQAHDFDEICIRIIEIYDESLLTIRFFISEFI